MTAKAHTRGKDPAKDFAAMIARVKGSLRWTGAGETTVARDTLEECLRLLVMGAAAVAKLEEENLDGQ